MSDVVGIFLDQRQERLERAGMQIKIDGDDAGRPDHRFNDRKCDPRGRFWAGTMNDVTRAPEGTLYRFEGAECIPFESGLPFQTACAGVGMRGPCTLPIP